MKRQITEAEIFEVPAETLLEGDGNARLLEEASRILGEVNNYASDVMEFEFIVQALKNAEALASARIEGTTGNLQDLYLEESLTTEKKTQLKLFSAINYRMAMNEIDDIVKKYKKIDLPLIRHLHKLLAENDPSTSGIPGKFRQEDVRVRNSRLGDFLPPSHIKVGEYMERLIKEGKERERMPTLAQAAIMHYQFESIHPFRDGNGRSGRMLITAQLLVDGALRAPMFNLSQYFDKNRDEYIDALRAITDKRSYQEWAALFLTAVRDQGKKNLIFIEKLRTIEKEDSLIINQRFHSPVATHVLRHALNKLYITVPSTEEYLEKQQIDSADLAQVSRTNIQRMVDEGVLELTTKKFGKAKVYAHKKLRLFMFGGRA
jgi:Fic family protein